MTQPQASRSIKPGTRSHDKEDILPVIAELQKQGAIEPCEPMRGQWLSPFFLVKKPNGKNRFILNLKGLNQFLAPPHFKMEDIRSVTKLVQKNWFMSSIDLKDAYFLVPIDPNHRKYLRFQYKNQFFEFTCLPFGLSVAPYVFTKIMRPVVKYLRSAGILCLNYLDDILILSENYEAGQSHIHVATTLLESLGFLINYNKSSLIPSTRCTFLGFIIDSHSMSLELPNEKQRRILKLVNEIKLSKKLQIRRLAHTLGVLGSSCPAIKYGWLYTKRLERDKYLALRRTNGNYNAYMHLSKHSFEDLDWWLLHTTRCNNEIRQDHFELEIFTDSSLTGWGAYCQGEVTNGWWPLNVQTKHINFLELLAIQYGLQCFANSYKSASILIRSDNTTAISYINRMGSVKFADLCSLARKIWQWAEERNLWLYASYISSDNNTIADQESRKLPPLETEWSLSGAAFHTIITTISAPEIDLFASYANFKCEKYVSWKRDPGAVMIDAFTISWKNLNFYAFPPFSLILRVLNKIINEKATGIVVVPHWPTQVWFPLFSKLIASEPIIFSSTPDLITSPYSSAAHPLKITLVAARLSGTLFH